MQRNNKQQRKLPKKRRAKQNPQHQVQIQKQPRQNFKSNQQRNKSVTITHTEYLSDVITGPAGEFTYLNYQINPGNNITFPWLPGIARNFDLYHINNLKFNFRSMSGNAITSVNTALGQVLMSLQYDAANPAFTTTRQQNGYESTVSIKPSQSATLNYDKRKSATQLQNFLVIGQQIPQNTAIQMCNVGNFQISTVGMQGSYVNVGQLWVQYSITFSKYKIPDSNDNAISSVVQVALNDLPTDPDNDNFPKATIQFEYRTAQRLPLIQYNNNTWFDLSDMQVGVYHVSVVAVWSENNAGNKWLMANTAPLVDGNVIVGEQAGYFGTSNHHLPLSKSSTNLGAAYTSTLSFYLRIRDVASANVPNVLRFTDMLFQADYAPDSLQIDVHPVRLGQ